MGDSGEASGPFGSFELLESVSPADAAFCLLHGPLGATQLDEEARILFVNHEMCRMLGYSMDELVGQRLDLIDPSFGIAQFERNWREFEKLEVGQVMTRRIETRHRKKDGTSIPVEILVRHVRGPDRHFHVSFVRDLSERREAERRLSLMEASVERAANGMFWSRPDGRIFYVNDEACRMLGYAREELLSMYVHDVDAQYERGSWERFWPTLREKKGTTVRTTHRRKDGRTYPVEVLVSHIELGDEEFSVGVARDLTEQVAADEEKARLEAQLSQAMKLESVGRLAGGVAHDFNNMLGVILGYCELLKEDLQGNEEALDSLEQIEQAANRSRDTTRQLLAFSRRQPVAPRVFDLNEHIRQARKTIMRLVPEDLQIELSLTEAPSPVRMDPAQLDQVLMNLVVNARDAMPSGGRLRVETARVEDTGGAPPQLVLAVADEGQGMDEAVVARAFEPFFTTKGQGVGTGLGLSTVFGIVDQSGGTVDLDSQLGAGTRVEVRLPVAEGTGTADLPIHRPLPRAQVAAQVMIVEDEALLRDLLAQMLRDLGYRVYAPKSVWSAIERGRTGAVDLVICDVVMPDLHGPALRERLLEARPGLPFLFISGYASDPAGEQLKLPKQVPLLEKPFTKSDLALAVDAALRGR